MLSSTCWPAGALFLDDLHQFIQQSSTHCPPQCAGRVFANLELELECIDTKPVPRLRSSLRPLEGASAHTALAAHRFLDSHRDRGEAFIDEGMKLPALAAHNLAVRLDLAIIGQRAPQGIFSLNEASMPAYNFSFHNKHPDAFSQTRSFLAAAQTCLDRIDKLDVCLPHANAPAWAVIKQAGRKGYDVVAAYLRANTPQDACFIASVLANITDPHTRLMAFEQEPDAPSYTTGEVMVYRK